MEITILIAASLCHTSRPVYAGNKCGLAHHSLAGPGNDVTIVASTARAPREQMVAGTAQGEHLDLDAELVRGSITYPDLLNEHFREPHYLSGGIKMNKPCDIDLSLI
ncbi:MAG: hypothetical protein C4B59_04290 [Candidatus Methanogaster sp.]|uniref:Uncharacterized protein n=1 Tax=Candidatus Methanogaster sp. TaxID=3386292 RepID=A0AC61L583_9EURY|nr:MAG: hypothetical protein C4B59_04290 [ANME-2 cluster archaeon]